MSFQDTLLTTKIDTSKAQTMINLQQWPQYVLCAGLGLLGGVTGVALAIGLAIVVQSLLFPMMIFSPGAVLLALVATVTGLGMSWLYRWIMLRISPCLFDRLDGQGIQVILIFSAFISLLQTFLFMYNV